MRINSSPIPVSSAVLAAPVAPTTLRDIVGINTQISSNPAVYVGATVVSNMNWLGLKRIRDNICWPNSGSVTAFQPILDANFTIDFYYGANTDPAWVPIDTAISRLLLIETAKPGTIDIIEGGSNIDSYLTYTYNAQTGYAAWRSFFIDYYVAIKSQYLLLNKKLAANSVGASLDQTAETLISNIGDLSAYCDYGNLKYYVGPGEPTWDRTIDGSADTFAKEVGWVQSSVSNSKPVIISATGVSDVLSSGSIYDPLVDAIINRLPGGSELTTDQKTAYNDFVLGGKADGWLAKMDRFVILAGVNREVSKCDILNNGDLTETGTPTFTAGRGFKGSGSSSAYLNTNFNPTIDGVQFTLNNAHIGVFVSTAPTTGSMIAGGTTTQLSATSGGTVGSCVNCAAATVAGHVLPLEQIVLDRWSGSGLSRFTSGFKASQQLAAATTLDNAGWKIGGAGAAYSDTEVGLFHCGGTISPIDVINIRKRFLDFLEAIGSTVQDNLTETYVNNDSIGLLTPNADNTDVGWYAQNPSQTWSHKRDGAHHRFEVRPNERWPGTDGISGDIGTNKNRSEVCNASTYNSAPYYWQYGVEVWESFSFMLESTAQVHGNTLCSQFHHADAAIGTPPNGIYQSYGDVDYVGVLALPDHGVTNVHTALQRGRIYRFVSNFKYDPTGTTGHYQVWIDGQQVLNLNNTRLGYTDSSGGAYAKFGIYRAWGSEFTTGIIVHYWNFEMAGGADALLARVTAPLPVYYP